MMKKAILLSLAACMLALAAPAQASYGLRAGAAFSSQTYQTRGARYTTHMRAGLTAGAYATLPVAGSLVLQPALMYEGKGGSDQEYQGYHIRTRLNYLVLPVPLLYQAASATGGYWTVGLGPYFGYGISGRRSGGSPTAPNSGDPFKEGQGSLKRFDFGGAVQAGYQFAGGWNIGLSTELGVANIAKGGNSKNGYRNTSFTILVGYLLGAR